jgi:hypothetical protein
MEHIILVEKPKKYRPRPRRKCKKTIELNHKELDCEAMAMVRMAHERAGWWTFGNAVTDLPVLRHKIP